MKRLEDLRQTADAAMKGLDASEDMKRRILQAAKPATSLEDLRRTADAAMSGLTAGPGLKYRIEQAAQQPGKKTFALPRWAGAAVCAALVLTIAVGGLTKPAEPRIVSHVAGQSGQTGEGSNEEIIIMADKDVSGNFSVRSTSGRSSDGSIWESGGSSFPLVAIDGRYYRLLNEMETVSQPGSSLGIVSTFTAEPSLSGQDGILSNVLSAGTEIRAVRGMSGTAVTAKIDGVWRVFQRVSYSSSALLGKEGLADTLQIAGHIESISLTGGGSVWDKADCEKLFRQLTDNAVYTGSAGITAKQYLILSTDYGFALQLAVKGDRVSACGTWSCPEFFEAFEKAAQ